MARPVEQVCLRGPRHPLPQPPNPWSTRFPARPEARRAERHPAAARGGPPRSERGGEEGDARSSWTRGAEGSVRCAAAEGSPMRGPRSTRPLSREGTRSWRGVVRGADPGRGDRGAPIADLYRRCLPPNSTSFDPLILAIRPCAFVYGCMPTRGGTEVSSERRHPATKETEITNALREPEQGGDRSREAPVPPSVDSADASWPTRGFRDAGARRRPPAARCPHARRRGLRS